GISPVHLPFPYTTLFRSKVAGSIGLKPARRQSSTQHLPDLDGCVEPFQRKGAMIRELELMSDKTFRYRVNDQLIRLCQCLEAGRSEEHTSELQSPDHLVC